MSTTTEQIAEQQIAQQQIAEQQMAPQQMSEADVVAAAAAAAEAASSAEATSTTAASELPPSTKQVELFNRLRRKAERMNAQARKAVNASPEMQQLRDEYRWDEEPLPVTRSSAEIEIPDMPATLREMSEVISDFKWRVSRRELTNLTEALKVDAAPLRHDMTKIYDAVLRETGDTKIYTQHDVTLDPKLFASFRARVAEHGAQGINGAEFVELWESNGLSAELLPLDSRNALAIDDSVTGSQAEYAMGLLDQLAEAHTVNMRARFDAQQALIAKKIHPIKQEHVSFEVARLSIIKESARRGVEPVQIDSSLPRAEQFKEMNQHLRRLYKMPTKKQRDRYTQLIRLTGAPPYPEEQVASFNGMFTALKELNVLASEKIAREAAAQTTAALPEEEAHMEGTFSQQLMAESGTAIADEEFVRQSEPYYDQDGPSRANFTPDELQEARNFEGIGNTKNDPYVNKLRATLKERGATVMLTEHAEFPEMLERYLGAANVPTDEHGSFVLEASDTQTRNDVALSLLDRLAEAREIESRLNTNEASAAPQRARGDWGDREAEPITEAQQYKFESLADQAGIQIMPQDFKPATQFNPQTSTQVAQPATRQEMSNLIDQLVTRVEAQDASRVFAGTVANLSPELYEQVAAKLPIESADFIQLRFREGMSAKETAMRLKLDTPAATSREKVATHQFEKALTQARASQSATAARAANTSVANAGIPLG